MKRRFEKLIALCFLTLITTAVCIGQNVAINTTGAAADVSALLDIVAADKGMLIPRVSLTSNTDAATISGTEANSLIIFNTNGSMTNANGIGYYYWDLPTLKWIYLAAASNGPGSNGQVLMSQGGGNNPQWSNVSAASVSGGGGATGCAACITSISTAEWTNEASWSACREHCRNLVEATYTDWRVPTFDEMIYYIGGSFNPPDGSWLTETWTSTPAVSTILAGTATEWIYVNENTGTWGRNIFSLNTIDCRCVR